MTAMKLQVALETRRVRNNQSDWRRGVKYQLHFLNWYQSYFFLEINTKTVRGLEDSGRSLEESPVVLRNLQECWRILSSLWKRSLVYTIFGHSLLVGEIINNNLSLKIFISYWNSMLWFYHWEKSSKYIEFSS